MTNLKLPLPDTGELAAALADAIVKSMPKDWWAMVGKDVVRGIDTRSLHRDIVAEVVARIRPPEVYKPGDSE